MKYFSAIACLFAGMTPSAYAQEPGAVLVPQEVSALAGCWQGTGSVMGKPVSITLAAKPITEGALFLVEADSHAVNDPADRYAAHLIFGGKAAVDGKPGGISAFFADSFGGDFTSVGTGSANASGFEVAYVYPDATFVNRWTVAPASASWTIVMKDEAGEETTFASYDLSRKQCAPSPTA